MQEKTRPVVIVKKRKSHVAAAHGGSWKIAYADFMTAMMTFFLVMWFLSSSTPEQRQVLSDYLNEPLKISLGTGEKDNFSDSPIPGGGDDVTKSIGEVHQNEAAQSHRFQGERTSELQTLDTQLIQLIAQDPRLRAMSSSLRIQLLHDGLLIQIIDKDNKPMFSLGSAKLSSDMRYILDKIAPILNSVPNRISLAGHTDSLPYAHGQKGYSNWELSADRANAARRELGAAGLAANKVLRVISMADTFNVQHASARSALNRRISILVLSQQKAQQILEEEEESAPPILDNHQRQSSASPSYSATIAALSKIEDADKHIQIHPTTKVAMSQSSSPIQQVSSEGHSAIKTQETDKHSQGHPAAKVAMSPSSHSVLSNTTQTAIQT